MLAPRPFDQYREIFRTDIQERKELLKYVFEKSDNISLWIIGLAVGGIAIFANNISNIQTSINPCFLKPILSLLAISVTAGIIYRVLFLYFFVVLNNTQKGMAIAFSNELTMDVENLLKGDETFNELIPFVENNLGDLSYLYNTYENAEGEAKANLYKSVVDSYIQSVEFAKKDASLALDFIIDTYSKFTGITKEKYLQKINNHKAGLHYKWIERFTTAFYITYILSFIAALFLFVYAS